MTKNNGISQNSNLLQNSNLSKKSNLSQNSNLSKESNLSQDSNPSKKKTLSQDTTPLIDALTKFQTQEPAYFRIPAHRFERGIDQRFTDAVGTQIFRYDLSEAEGLDDLHHAEGAIWEAQELAADLWKARKSYFLVNGTTCGNEAMMLTAVRPGEKVLVMRNMHKSILMGLILSGAVPVFVHPSYDEKWKLWCSVTPEAIEDAFTRHPDCRAVFLVSPNYYGIASDLAGIAKICHAHDALLCVDEAHGSHLYFTEELIAGALPQGVDLCAQSIHKTAGSMTQSSILQVGSDRVDLSRLESNLQMVQSTSPSYVLMASLDAARHQLAMHGPEMMHEAAVLAQAAREELKRVPLLEVLEADETIPAIYALDQTRLVFSARAAGITGYRLQELLYEVGGVSTELADEENVVCVVTFANNREDIRRLVETLQHILDGCATKRHDTTGRPTSAGPGKHLAVPEMVLTPRDAYFHKKTTILWEHAVGEIAGEMIVPYPPGIPLIYPGERVTEEILHEINRYRDFGCVLHGPKDDKLHNFQIIKVEAQA